MISFVVQIDRPIAPVAPNHAEMRVIILAQLWKLHTSSLMPANANVSHECNESVACTCWLLVFPVFFGRPSFVYNEAFLPIILIYLILVNNEFSIRLSKAW
jgi:hypothetical protein